MRALSDFYKVPQPRKGGGTFCLRRNFMKRILIFTILLCLCGCVPTDPEIDPNLVKMEITEYSEGKIGFEILNNSKDNIVFGEEYILEFYDGERWTEVPERTETFFIAIAHLLENGESYCSSVNIEARYGTLSHGKYRIAKDVRFETEDGIDYGGQRVYGEFEVAATEK